MIVRQYAPCSLGRSIICLGKQGEINALRVEFDVSAWMAMYPDATVKLMHFAPDRPQDNPVIPTLGVEGTLRVWIVGEEDTAGAGNGVIELLLIDERTGSTIKSATGYTTVLRSPSAGIEAQEAEAGYVRYDVDQSALLTDEQKAVARKNIGAGTGDGTGSGGILKETDPTVPDWAKQPNKPTYTASEVGALPSSYTPPVTSVNGKTGAVALSAQDVGARPDTWTPSASDVGADAAGTASGAVAAHNTSGAAHADLRALIDGLTSRLNALADSDDTTLDQLSEIVAYIKNNKSLIDAVTTGKVSVSDIVDNLTTNASGKVLSAAQGVALKAMIDGIVIPTALPNPQPITINGQRYDGSEAVTVTVSSEGGGTPVEIDDTLTQSGKAADAKAVGDQLSALNGANALQDTEIAKKANNADLAAVAKSGSYNDLTDKPNSDINIVYPLQRSPYYDLLAKKIQNKALNANLVSTNGYMAHSSMGVSDGDFMCIAWGENNTEGDTSTDTSTSSGKWHVRCKIFGGYYGFKYHLLNDYNLQSTEAFDVFPAGTEVLDASGSSLGTIVSSSDSTVTKDFVNDNNKGHFVISSLCYMSTGKKIAVSRRLVATYANKAVSYTLANEIFPFTLTVDGVNGENDLKRVNAEWPSTLGYGSCGYSYNSTDKKFYLAATISNTGVALLSTTDFVEHTYVAFYPYDKASLECALFFDTAWISNTYKSGVYLACRSVYGHEYIRLAKLDYSNGYSVMDEIDLPATTSRPFFTQSYNKSTDVPCYLMVSDYTRARASIYQVVQKNIRQLRPIAVIDEMCCNYPAIFNVSETNISGARDLNYIICGTNGVASDIKGVSWFYENLKFGTYSLDDFKYELPIASATQLGGVMPAAKTNEMTQAVGVDDAGGLWTMAWGTLPIASPTTLGGVKVGTGLTIAENGVLSLNVPSASGVSF